MNPKENKSGADSNDIQVEIQNFINMINSTDKPIQFEGLVGIRRLISMGANPPFQKVIASGVVPKLLKIMTWEDEPKFQVESTWCILNICAGEDKFSDYIVQIGGLDIIADLLNSKVDVVVEQAIWAICNIAVSSTKNRDLCLEKDCFDKLLQILEKFPTCNHIQNNSVRCIANLCQGKPAPDWDIILPALPVLHKHISDVYSEEALEDALWSLAYISEDNIQEVIDQGCVPFLIQHLCKGSPMAFAGAMRVVGNLLSGTDKQTNVLLDCPEFLPKLFETTAHPKKIFKKEAWWAISNITAGTSKQIDMIIQNDDFVKKLKTAIEFEEKDVAREVGWAICNLFSSANGKQIGCIIKELGLMKSFTHILTKFDESLKQEALEAILTVLKNKESDLEATTSSMKEVGLIEILKELAKNDEFSSSADGILEYFSGEVKGEDANNQDNSERED